jgi:2,4-dienoyl-CoA reductase-like NADH-dependent reductase (Old Yellow Enzyme family)
MTEPNIATPLTLPNGQVLPNRLAKAAMTEGLADGTGRPTEALCRLYERWSRGGVGLLLTGNVQIDRHHLERAGNVVIDRAPDPLMRERLAAFARAAKVGGSKVWMQVSHAGRQTPKPINPRPKAPSAVPMRKMPLLEFGEPVAMTEGDVRDTIARFVTGARAAEEAGFDGVQIHSAHGYLLSSFLSPIANRRTDGWGGSLESRARLLIGVVEGVKAAVGPAFTVAVKLNSADFQRGGFGIDDSVQVAGWLDAAGMDCLEISGGTYEAAKMMGDRDKPKGAAQTATAAREAYFVEFAPTIRKAIDRAVLMVTGGFRTAAAMDKALADDGVDLIGLGRPVLAEPDGPKALLSGRASLRRVEDELRIGPGALSPQSRLAFMKTLNASATQAWYYEQMDRLGAGLDVDRSQRILKAAQAYMKRDKAKRETLEL